MWVEPQPRCPTPQASIYEALLRLPWLGFYPWLKEHHLQDLRHVIPTIDTIRTLLHDICSDTLGTLGLIKK